MTYRIRQTRSEVADLDNLQTLAEVEYRNYRVVQYENGTVRISADGQSTSPALPLLRIIAADLGVSLSNAAGGARDTRQLAQRS